MKDEFILINLQLNTFINIKFVFGNSCTVKIKL